MDENRRRQTGLLPAVLKWAMMAGAIGFCAGFFGPMLLAPDANQGPLLGIFITGPLGFVAGAALRLVYALLAKAGRLALMRAERKLRRLVPLY